MPVRRLFVSLPLPASVRDALVPVRRPIEAAVPQRTLGWTAADTWHVTLRFLGDVDEERIPELENRLRSELNGAEAFKAGCRGLEWLPGPRRPRVLYARVESEPGRLESLHARVMRATAGLGGDDPGRPFVAHATLARVKNPMARGVDWRRLIAPFSNTAFGCWTIDACLLMASELRPEGARHTEVCRVALTPAARPA